MSPVLAIPSFGGGVVLEGSADVQRTDELQAADNYDIGPRGQLVAASDLSGFANAQAGLGVALTPVYGLDIIRAPQLPLMVFLGDHGGHTYQAVLTLNGLSDSGTDLGATPTGGIIASYVAFPYVDTTGAQIWVMLLCAGARFFQHARTGPGLFAIDYDPATATYGCNPISKYDALGTGDLGEFLGGTNAVQLYPRFIIGYNNFAFLFGFDNHDATTGDGPTRVMFSNLGNPLKYGLDPSPPPAVEADRAFTDSDAFTLGGAGEVCRGGCVWNGKLFVGTNRGLHYIAGFGRESFLTNGALPVAESRPIVGPHALIEGPDRVLYGVAADAGLWRFDGATTDPVGQKLRDFNWKSNGYWDLIWTDTSRTLASFPGQSNQDLVWMLADSDLQQVWIVIPYCSISNGAGYGTDTVVIKYHVLTGGFTRQKFAGKILLKGAVFEAEQTGRKERFLCAPGTNPNIQYYAHKSTIGGAAPMPSSLPSATFGEYAPHGPDGVGVQRKLYLTLSWESSSALPLVFTITPYVDQEAAGSAITLTIGPTQPVGPSDGDLWFDTSGTDTNLGNGTAGSFIPAHAADYLLKRYKTTFAKWIYTFDGGEQGTRASIPIAYTPARGTRVKHSVVCTSAAGRYQIEGLGLEPATIRSDK